MNKTAATVAASLLLGAAPAALAFSGALSGTIAFAPSAFAQTTSSVARKTAPPPPPQPMPAALPNPPTLSQAPVAPGMPASSVVSPSAATAPAPATLPSDIPVQFEVQDQSFDYIKRSVMIPMRDGVKLRTVILIPRGAQHAPILLTRTPYGAEARIDEHPNASLEGVLGDGDEVDEMVTKGGYIRVLQDIRGKHGSEGDYVMTRPLVGPLNPTTVDESTDAWDTIDWLVKHTPESNGRVGILGISYDGFTALMALFHPHPALKAAVPINAMVDGWMGDDWFHQGAFRTDTLDYIYEQEATRGSDLSWWHDAYDQYSEQMKAGSAGALGRSHGLDQLGFFTKLLAHPAYDQFWQQQAIDKLLAKQGLSVPTMLVHSLWDQEDIYGNIAVYKALAPSDKTGLLHLVIGPWFHHQERLDGSSIGPLQFGSDTAATFRSRILAPFLDRALKTDDKPPATPPVIDFVTGVNRWERRAAWPGPVQTATLHLGPQTQAGFTAPVTAPANATGTTPTFRSYVSDPANPVPFLPRPVHLSDEAGRVRWQTWLVSDQRAVSGRPDVLEYTTAPLTEPMRISGQPVAHIDLSTTGTDGDLVVKLIDLYPDTDGREPGMGGYELMVSADILRGRYRESFADPKPITPGQMLPWRLAMPTVNHVFLPGHRIMVQIQSSWFPLYDRNPQSYVANIFLAQPGDYKPAEIHIQDTSTIMLPVMK